MLSTKYSPNSAWILSQVKQQRTGRVKRTQCCDAGAPAFAFLTQKPFTDRIKIMALIESEADTNTRPTNSPTGSVWRCVRRLKQRLRLKPKLSAVSFYKSSMLGCGIRPSLPPGNPPVLFLR